MKTVIIISLLFISTFSFSQTYSNLDTRKKDTTEYKYMLPILGKQVHALGFDLPYAGGLGVNYIWQQSELVVSNTEIGFNNNELINVNDIVRFNSVSSISNGINIRPDIWVLPFLNIYGVFAKAQSRTFVDVGIWIPNTVGSEELFSIQTSPVFNTTTAGFGITPTAGFFSGWIALDMNFTWSDVDALEDPVFVFVFDPRIGKTFNFKKKEQNLSIWVGGFRLGINRKSEGSLPLNEVLNTAQWQENINAGYEKVGNAQNDLDNWWGSLTPIEQKNPVNIAKHEANQAKLDLAGNVLNKAEDATNSADNSIVNFNVEKRQKDNWNYMFGAQFQYNKHWMIRAEYGGLSSRQHVIIGLQYRFGI